MAILKVEFELLKVYSRTKIVFDELTSERAMLHKKLQ